MKEGYNSSYRIATYHLSEKLEQSIIEEMKRLNLSAQTFTVQSIDDIEIKKEKALMEQPEILLIGEEEPVTKAMKEYAFENFIQIVRVSEKILRETVTLPVFTISISTLPFPKEVKTDGGELFTTELKEGVTFLKNLAQIVNMTKLQYIGQELLKSDKFSLESREEKDTLLSCLINLNQLICLKDSYTVMHSDRVSEYAVLMGEQLGLSKIELELLRIGGKLHDIGKIGIPDAILQKCENLTAEEFSIIKRHTIIGSEILPRKGYSEIKEMIRYHHERIDGTGYPDGLQGEQIPYMARILSVADTFDAMTTQRSYNRRKTLKEALAELRKVSIVTLNQLGKVTQQLDPILVESLIEGLLKNEEFMAKFVKQDTEILQSRQQETFSAEKEKVLGNKKNNTI